MPHFLTAAVFVALTATSSASPVVPTPTPLKIIVRERVSPFCTQVRQTIGGTVIGLMHNDEWVQSAKAVLAKMSRDWVSGGEGSIMLDRTRLSFEIGGLVRNLTIINDQLAKVRTVGNSSGDAEIATMKAQLSAAADQQREVLNILATAMDASGKSSPSLELEEFYRHSPRASASAIANVRERYDNDSMVYRDPILSQITGVFGDAPYANNLLYLIANDLETQSLESKAAKSIVTYSTVCRGSTPLAPPSLPYVTPPPGLPTPPPVEIIH